MRDDFPQRIKNQAAARVGWVCSNPECRQPTSGPSASGKAVTNVGVAAHIIAASPEGPRSNLELTSQERRSLENALWLCQRCGKAIDDDPLRYTQEVLEGWKVQAESEARKAIEAGPKRLGRQRSIASCPKEKAVSILVVEDDGGLAEDYRKIFTRYTGDILVSVARDAGEAVEQIDRERPDVLLLDLMMPYGSSETILDGKSDPDGVYAGLRLLSRVRAEENEGAKPIWVAVVTARSSVGTLDALRDLLGSRGRLYLKPFDTLRLESDVVSLVGVSSKVPYELFGEDTESIA